MSKQDKDSWTPLADALRTAKQETPWVSQGALRAAVIAGLIDYARSSNRSRAHYFVRPDEFKALRNKLSKQTKGK